MPRSSNAQLAVRMFDDLVRLRGYDAQTAWKAIAQLLLSCELHVPGVGWTPFHGCIVFRDSDQFALTSSGDPNDTIQKSKQLGAYLAKQLSIDEYDLCANIGLYWREPNVRPLQPHNPVGHAFRSLAVAYLERFGDPQVKYAEEVSPWAEFPGFDFPGASPRARVDVVARRGLKTVAVVSAKWRFRHDRVEFIEEGFRYVIAARRQNPNCRFYALTGEFTPARLHKLLEACPPVSPRGPLDGAVHFAPHLIWDGTNENGRTKYLMSLEQLAQDTYNWK